MTRLLPAVRSAAPVLALLAVVAAAGAGLPLYVASRGGLLPTPLAIGIAAGAAVLAWLVLATSIVLLIDRLGSQKGAAVLALGRRVAGLSDPSEAALDRVLAAAVADVGDAAEAFRPSAVAVREARSRATEARAHAAALLQINPHYVLLCTLDGHIVEANPAFYAVTGLPFEAVRGGRIEVLDDVMPVGPLFDLARRSAREGSSLSGIEYALVNRDDVRRPVQVSLRAVPVGGKEGVMIQATDVSNQRQLEHQITTFSDALDLMVDQRVAQLTAGQATLRRVLDDAGVVVVTFDGNGGTRRFSRAAEALTGRPAGLVPHFGAFTVALGLQDAERGTLSDWFLGPSEGAFQTEGRPGGGPPRRFVWRKAVAGEDGRTDRRVLVGMEMARRPAAGPAVSSGDGASVDATPSPAPPGAYAAPVFSADELAPDDSDPAAFYAEAQGAYTTAEREAVAYESEMAFAVDVEDLDAAFDATPGDSPR